MHLTTTPTDVERRRVDLGFPQKGKFTSKEDIVEENACAVWSG